MLLLLLLPLPVNFCHASARAAFDDNRTDATETSPPQQQHVEKLLEDKIFDILRPYAETEGEGEAPGGRQEARAWDEVGALMSGHH